MTTKLYYDDSYLIDFCATVVDCIISNDEYHIVLDKTAFYPEGGGQPTDTGHFILNKEKIPVTAVFEKEGIIYHKTSKAIGINSAINGVIDFDRRFDHMQQHTGEHILSGIINSEYGFDNVGFHLGKDEILVDFNGVLNKEDINKIQTLSNEEIYFDRDVLASFPNDLKKLNYRSKKELTGKVRIVAAGNADSCACCGTHTKTTGMVGAIIITGFIAYKGGTRISMLCGKRAIDYYTKVNDNLFEINKLLSKNNDTVLEAVKSTLSANISLKAELSKIKAKLFEVLIENINAIDGVILYSYDYLTSAEMQRFIKLLSEKAKICMLVSLQDDNTYKIIITSSQGKAREIGTDIATTFNGKGGGSKDSFQGFIKNFTQEHVLTILNIHK